MKRLRKFYGCPVELSLDLLGGKWSTVILSRLKEAAHRYGELRDRIPGLADKVLTERLKQLEARGLVEKRRAEQRDTGHVYRLTTRGEGLRPALQALYSWGQAMGSEMDVRIGPETKTAVRRL